MTVGTDLEFVPPDTIYDGVVKLAIHKTGGEEDGLCSGALLPDGISILTAAHCVTREGTNVSNVSTVDVTFELPGGPKTFGVPAGSVFVHPGWNGDYTRANDLAILRLPVMAPSGPNYAVRYDIYRDQDEAGKVFDLVGYGMYSTNALQGVEKGDKNVPRGERTHIRNTIDFVGRYDYREFGVTVFEHQGDTSLSYDHDSGRTDTNILAEIGPSHHRKIWREGMAAPGDSGGPAFVQGRIAGVVSYGWSGIPLILPGGYDTNLGANSSYGDVGVLERVSAHQGWIDGFTKAPRPVIVDMNFQMEGQDGIPDTIQFARRQPSFTKPERLMVYINGRLADEIPLSQVSGVVQFIGSSDPETIIVSGDLRTQGINIMAAGGTDELILQTSNYVVDLNGESAAATYSGDVRLAATWSGIQQVTLHGGSRDLVRINETRRDIPVVIQDSRNVVVGNGTRHAIDGTVTIANTRRTTNLTLDDSLDSYPNRYDLRSNGLPVSGAGVYFDNTDVTELTIKAGRGDDFFDLPMADAPREVLVIDAGGADRLFYEDQVPSPGLSRYEVDAGRFQQLVLRPTPDNVFAYKPIKTLNYDGIEEARFAGVPSSPNRFLVRDTEPAVTTTIIGGSEADWFEVLRTSATGVLDLLGREGDDAFHFGGTNNPLYDSNGYITIIGGDGDDKAVFDDRSQRLRNQRRFVTVTDESVHVRLRGTPYTFSPSEYVHQGLESIELFGANSVGSYRIASTGAATPVVIHGGESADTFTLGDNLGEIRGSVSLHGKGGHNRLFVNDTEATTRQAYGLEQETGLSRHEIVTLPDGSQQRIASMAEVNTTEISEVSITGGSGEFNDYVLTSVEPGMQSVTLVGNPAAQDVFSIDASSNSLGQKVTVQGQGGADLAYYSDQRNWAGAAYDMFTDPTHAEALTIQRLGVAPVSFQGVTQLNALLAPPPGPGIPSNSVSLRSLPADMGLNLLVGDGYTVTLGSQTPQGSDLQRILGQVLVAGSSADRVHLILDDSGNPSRTPRTITIDPYTADPPVPHGRIAGMMPWELRWRLGGGSTIELRGSAADEKFELTGELVDVVLTIEGGGGDDDLP